MTKILLSTRPFLFWSLLLPATTHGQALPADSGFVSTALNRAKLSYTRALGAESHLYNGVQYKEMNATDEAGGIPYFLSDDWVEGTVFYDGELYEQVPILYDLVRDKLVIEHGVNGIKLELIDQKVMYFTLPGHHFVHLLGDTIKGSILTSGYYDLQLAGKVKLYVKWQKERLEIIEDNAIRVLFVPHNSFYIVKNGSFIPVQTKASVLKALNDNKSLRKFIRKNGIQFRQDRVRAITLVVSQYNESENRP